MADTERTLSGQGSEAPLRLMSFSKREPHSLKNKSTDKANQASGQGSG